MSPELRRGFRAATNPDVVLAYSSEGRFQAERTEQQIALTQRHGIEAIDERNTRVYAMATISQKPYSCMSCHQPIPLHAEHALIVQEEPDLGRDHHHLHLPCFHEDVLPLWSKITSQRRKRIASAIGRVLGR